MAVDSSPRAEGRMQLADEGQNDQANVDANLSHP
jgi:hypothetical protein